MSIELANDTSRNEFQVLEISAFLEKIGTLLEAAQKLRGVKDKALLKLESMQS